MQGYKITIDIDAAFGITRANPQFGQGGLPQVSFFFREGKIYMVSLINCDENISEDREKERKEIHDRILIQEGIESGKEYNWGKIESKYDVRSNVSSIDIF